MKAKVFPLHIRRKCSILRLMYARVKTENSQPKPVGNNERLTRANALPQLEYPFPHSEALKRSINYTGPRYWEILLGRLKIIPDLKAFKSEVNMYIEDGFV